MALVSLCCEDVFFFSGDKDALYRDGPLQGYRKMSEQILENRSSFCYFHGITTEFEGWSELSTEATMKQAVTAVAAEILCYENMLMQQLLVATCTQVVFAVCCRQ